jgi:endo-1,4-beta-xylanase
VDAYLARIVLLWLISPWLLFPLDAAGAGLRDLEGRVKVGTVATFYDFRLRWDDGRFRETMIREYSMVTAPDFEWHAPWDEQPLRPARDVYDFTVNDAVVEFIESAGLRPRGHPLLHPSWNLRGDRALPAWLTQGNWTRDEAIAILREHILTVVGRYKGRIKAWAVVNEPVSYEGLLDYFWLRAIGPEYIEMAFRWAHEADPDAYLYLNDDGGEGMNILSEKTYDLVKSLVQKGVPIHGVGLEMHIDLQYRTLGGDLVNTPAGVIANMERYAALGLKVEITEMDVRLSVPASNADLAAQARIYGEMLDACLSVAACIGFNTWGFTDRYSYIARAFPGLGASLPFDEEFMPKPAYFALQDRLAKALIAPPAPVLNVQGLWWASPAGSESGWGINFAHQGKTIFGTWFTYDIAGKPWWLAVVADEIAPGVFKGDLFTTTGPPFNAIPFDSSLVVETTIGTATFTFADSDHGTFAYTVNVGAPPPLAVTRTKSITRQVFGPVPTCGWGIVSDLTKAANVQDLWWRAGGEESGWGINLTHQGDVIFATWFTYDESGTPWWLAFVADKTGPGVYAGNVFATTGPPFDAVQFDAARVAEATVGNATLTFIDGNRIRFSFQVNGIAGARTIVRQVFVSPGTSCQ